MLNLQIKDLHAKSPIKEVQKLLDEAVLVKQSVSFQLKGVNIAVANGLRRVLMSELYVKAMFFELDELQTNDPFIINDYIQSRVRQIPLHQSANEEEHMYLDVVAGDVPMTVYTKHIKTKSKNLFNPNIVICTLGAHFHLKINIRIKRLRGYDFGANIVSTGATCLPLDQTPFDVAQKTGVRSSMCNPHEFLIKFNTNGTDSAKNIIINSCNNIINRISHISKVPNLIKSQSDIHIIALVDETDTIGALISRTMFDLYDDLEFINYFVHEYDNVCEIKFKTSGDKDKMLGSALKKIIETYEQIKNTL